MITAPLSQAETTAGKHLLSAAFTFFECDSSNKRAAIKGVSLCARSCSFIPGKQEVYKWFYRIKLIFIL